MFKIISLILSLISVLSVFAQNADTLNRTNEEGKKYGYWIVKDAGGVKTDEGNYVDNKKEGIWKGYYPSGKIKHEITFKANRPDGYAKFYYEDGVISEEGNWKINKWVGEYKYFHTNGNLAYDFKFNENGKRTGEQKYYYADGAMMYKGDWKEGKKEGVLTEYYPDGSIKSEMDFADGKVNLQTIKEFELAEKPSGKISAPKLQTVKEEGSKTNNPSDIKKQSEMGLDVFSRTGYFKTYNEHKKIDREGDFVKGKLVNGKRYIYDDNGNLTKTLVYQDGKVVEVIEN